DDLGALGRADAEHAMPGGLRAARDDAHLVADQPVEQRRFSHVRATEQSDQAAAEAGRAHCRSSCSSAARAACCSACRRVCPSPRVAMPSSGTRHSITKVWRCGSPAASISWYAGVGSARFCSRSCNWVLGSLGMELGSSAANWGAYSRRITSLALSTPARSEERRVGKEWRHWAWTDS